MDNFITDVLVLIIDLYIVLLFVRLFATERERYDNVLGLVFMATDPIINQLRPLLPWRSLSVPVLLVIVALLLLKGILRQSIPLALLGVADTLFLLYVLIIIIIATVREYYTNPIASLGQRMVRPVQTVAMRFASHAMVVHLISVGLLVLAHAVVRLVLRELMDGSGLNPLLPREVFIISSLRLIVNLTVFFTYVIIINALLSWVSPDPLNPIVQLLTLIAAPITEPFRRLVPPLGGAIDISPLLAIVALQFANVLLHLFLNVVQRGLQ